MRHHMHDAVPPHVTVHQHPERAAPDAVPAILAEGLIAHVGIIDDGRPVVIPMTFHFDSDRPDVVHLHGGHESRLLKHMASGAPVCVTITLVDGLVASKMGLMHSVNYRSVVAFGEAMPAPDTETARTLMDRFIERYFPGRTVGVDYQPVPDPHLAATAFVPLKLTASNAKIRRGGPKGAGDHDATVPGTAGVVHFTTSRRFEMTTMRSTSDSSTDPAAYVAATYEALGTRDPLQVLGELKGHLEGVLASCSPERLARPEAVGKWSVLQVIQHLADMEVVCSWRFRHMLTKDRALLQSIDETAWMNRLRGGDADVTSAVELLFGMRQANIRLWQTVTPAEMTRAVVHEERGEQTVHDWLRAFAGHDIIHRNQIARILATVA